MKRERSEIELHVIKREFIKFGIGRGYGKDDADNIWSVIRCGLHPHYGLANLQKSHYRAA